MIRRRATSPIARMRHRLHAAQQGQRSGEDGMALLTVLLLMFVVSALAVLVLGVVLSQVAPSRATQESTRTVFAAEAGVQTALTQIRTATSSGGRVGSRYLLPCSVSGTTDGSGGTVSYSATIQYFLAPPGGQSAAWRDANQLPCTPGGGPSRTPNYALVTSTASDTSRDVLTRGRSLQATYTFNVVNQNVPGGMLMSAQGAACLQAASAQAGSTISYVASASCTGAPLQMWVYDTNFHIVLASTAGTGNDLCLSQPQLTVTDRTVTLQPCASGTSDPMQLWGYGDNAQFKGQNANNTDYGTNCLWSGQTSPSPVGFLLKSGGSSSTCQGGNQDWGAFAPEPRVGAGPAGLATTQIVNYQQFGRCTDVTGFNINASYMIVYPCKQDPSPGMTHLAWNHKWFYGAETGTRSEPAGATAMSTRIRVFVSGTTQYCLTTPSASTSPAYLVFRTCDGTASQQFSRTYGTGDPLTSYQFRTSDGRCMAAGPTVSAGLVVSTLVAAPCTSGAEQKWNAPPTLQDAVVSGQVEVGSS